MGWYGYGGERWKGWDAESIWFNGYIYIQRKKKGRGSILL